MKKVYIVGAVSGDKNYKKKFSLARADIKFKSCIILTPLDYPEGLTQEDYMRLSINYVFLCDLLYVTSGYERSKGTLAEIALAKSINRQIVYQI